jgi:hypothetical protein
LGALAALSAFELAHRQQGLSDAKASFERRWIVLQSAKVDALQVAFLLPDGVARYSDILAQAGAIRVSMPGVRLFPPDKAGAVSTVALASTFSPDVIRQRGRVGVANAIVSSQRDADKEIKSVTCVESAYTTSTVLSRPGDTLNSALVCSVTVTIPVVDGVSLRALQGAASRVEVTLRPLSDSFPCLGPCRQPAALSLRLVVREVGHLLPTLIEISPLLYNASPSKTTARGVPVSLPGPDVLRLAESRFKESFGFRDPSAFAFTLGIVHAIWRRTTERTTQMGDSSTWSG